MKHATVVPGYRTSASRVWSTFALSAALAALLGAAAGWLASFLAPAASTVWVSLALLPLWLLLEIYLQLARDLCGGFGRALRVASTVAVLGGFYGAWFYFASAAA
jgi:hypothetical protein